MFSKILQPFNNMSPYSKTHTIQYFKTSSLPLKLTIQNNNIFFKNKVIIQRHHNTSIKKNTEKINIMYKQLYKEYFNKLQFIRYFNETHTYIINNLLGIYIDFLHKIKIVGKNKDFKYLILLLEIATPLCFIIWLLAIVCAILISDCQT